MAAAPFNSLNTNPDFKAISAGTSPAEKIHPEIQAAMLELGIDLGCAKPQKLTDEMARSASLLITMSCQENCPYVPGLMREDWSLQDPKGLSGLVKKSVYRS